MIENFTVGVIYGICVSTVSGLLGYIVYSAFQLVKGGSKSDDDE